ncbi:MAG TPA: hypothetical protein VFY84_10920, partial [Jiangellales bacterium]|nr:hypothetical protein [Jiangellales bacterium]
EGGAVAYLAHVLGFVTGLVLALPLRRRPPVQQRQWPPREWPPPEWPQPTGTPRPYGHSAWTRTKRCGSCGPRLSPTAGDQRW